MRNKSCNKVRNDLKSIKCITSGAKAEQKNTQDPHVDWLCFSSPMTKSLTLGQFYTRFSAGDFPGIGVHWRWTLHCMPFFSAHQSQGR